MVNAHEIKRTGKVGTSIGRPTFLHFPIGMKNSPLVRPIAADFNSWIANPQVILISDRSLTDLDKVFFDFLISLNLSARRSFRSFRDLFLFGLKGCAKILPLSFDLQMKRTYFMSFQAKVDKQAKAGK